MCSSDLYRGRAPAPISTIAGWRTVPVAALSDLGLSDTALQSMLNRYAKERTQDAFGIYIGNHVEGEVRHLAAA